jgi:hypothetical protein
MRLPVLHKSPALRPTELSKVTSRAVDELLREGESQNTLASYRSAPRYCAAWFAMRYGVQIALPVPFPAVLHFIVDHAQRTSGKGLVHELPPQIDQALVEAGFKGKCGALSLNTLVPPDLADFGNPCTEDAVHRRVAPLPGSLSASTCCVTLRALRASQSAVRMKPFASRRLGRSTCEPAPPSRIV